MVAGVLALLAAVCAAKVKMAKGIAKLKTTDAESAVGPGKVANWMDSIRQGMTSVTEQLPELSASDRQKVPAASQEFSTSFVDLGLDMSTALSQNNANAKIQAKVAELSDAFDSSYGTISCPQQ